MSVDVRDVPELKRYEARVDGRTEVAGRAEYIRTPELIAFTHTEVEPGHEGQGVGSALVSHALDAARADNLRVLATCPFFAQWIARHPDYQDLLYQSRSNVSD
ncbi:GNAT family N-acetyltransferase [Streptomyces lonarensis]|uniref:N-acetyltransferase n=1 Tax=Streptomyces lonarensis TaxID=700599 RepID=A0A7X6CZ75_9ACTN|nr:GNAT family N-acetyltransferase [Streptomyces lonarensis]NJQ05252.1 N-acetyltransferase [Streptomyces lonarensis]